MKMILIVSGICIAVLLAACGSGSSNANHPSNPNASATSAPAPTIAAPAPTEPSAAVPTTAASIPTSVPAAQPTSAGTASPTLIPQLQLTAEPKDTIIVLTWTDVPEVSGYSIYRDGNTAPLTTKPITQTTFQDIGLTNGRTYSYTVAAVSADGTIASGSAPITAIPNSH